MSANIGYDATGDGNQNDTESRAPDTSSSAISTISRSQRLQADEGTLLTVNTNDTYFSEEKVPIPDVDTVIMIDDGITIQLVFLYVFI